MCATANQAGEVCECPVLAAAGDLFRLRMDRHQSAASKGANVGMTVLDGQKVLVLTNSGVTRAVALQLGAMMTELTLATNSVTTLTWA